MARPFKHITPEDRFWANVSKTLSCWNWTGGRSKSTDKIYYGHFKVGVRSQMVHRFSYALHKGPIPEGMLVCHTCDNGLCVNPDHLFVGTQLDNMRDCKAKGRIAKGGAILTPEKVREIRLRHKPWSKKDGAVAIAREMGLSRSCISQMISGRRWRDVK